MNIVFPEKMREKSVKTGVVRKKFINTGDEGMRVEEAGKGKRLFILHIVDK